MKTRIIIIDDHPFIRKGIITYLCKENDLDIIGEADSGEAALQLARSLSPDIVLLDLILTDMSGDRVIKEIKKNYPYIKTIVISNYSDYTHIKTALSAGAFGYLVKTDPPQMIIKAIRDAMLGKKTFTKLVKEKLIIHDENDCVGNSDQALLTRREIEILGYLSRGLSNHEIATRCCISESTVRSHIHHLKAKRGIRSRQKLMLYALQEGLN